MQSNYFVLEEKRINLAQRGIIQLICLHVQPRFRVQVALHVIISHRTC